MGPNNWPGLLPASCLEVGWLPKPMSGSITCFLYSQFNACSLTLQGHSLIGLTRCLSNVSRLQASEQA